MHVVLGDHRLLLARRRPALGLPTRWRDAIGEGADHHEDEIDHAHRGEGFPDPDGGGSLEVVDQKVRKRRTNHGAAAEAHDRHARRHAAAVRKPFHQCRHRGDIAETETDATDDAGAEPHDPELVHVDAEGADQKTATPAASGDSARLAWTGSLEPAAPDRGRDTEQHEEQGVHPSQARDFPVATGGEQLLPQRHVGAGFGRRQPDRARQRQPEHAEAIGHADAKMDAQRRGRHQPAVETRLCNRVFTIENSAPHAGNRAGAFNSRHSSLLEPPTRAWSPCTIR